MACKKMAEEQTPEHLTGVDPAPTESFLDGAGYRSAVNLLADLDEQGQGPLHRHIGEFLGGRYLARLIDNGLPASRVVALMTNPGDGRVVSPLRGLSAWLAAHSPNARQLLIDADPVGVGLYGDISSFSTDERGSLLKSLATFAAQGSLFGHEGRDGRVDGFGDNTAWAFRSLASSDMAISIGELLSSLETGYQQDRVMEFILRVLSEADGSELPHLSDLESVILAIPRNHTWPPHVRESALRAYLHITPEGNAKADTLLRLLEDIDNRTVPDPDDDLRGDLLRYLYPTWVLPSDVWRYVTPRNRPNYFGHFARFWRFDLLKQSSDQHIAELLDSFCKSRSQLSAALEQSRIEDLFFLLLDRGLEVWGDGLDSSRLYDWLETPRRFQRFRTVGEEAVQRIRAWLEARPQAQESGLLTWIKRRELDDLLAKQDAESRQWQADWRAQLRTIEVDLRENRASPRILHTLASVYFALFIEVEEEALPQERISEFVGGDVSLVDAVLVALREAVFREDLPDVNETISLSSESRHHYLAYPVLAAMDLLQAGDPTRLDALDDEHKRKALAIRYCVADSPMQVATSPCHDRWLFQNPDLVLDVLYQCAVAALRAGEYYLPGLNDLDRVAGLEDRVHKVKIRLLRALSVRAPSKQMPLLDRLLGQALRYPDTAALSALVEKKLNAKSATDAQRVRWLAVSALLSPQEHREPLQEFVGYDNDRTRHLAEFLRGASEDDRFGPSVMGNCSEPALLRDVIKMLGRLYAPLMVNGFVTLEMDASDRVASLIIQLGSLSGNEAQQALASLVDDPQLVDWQNYLKRTLESQRILIGDASYVHPSMEEVQHTLSNGQPANAADLAALVNDRLEEVSRLIQGDNSNLWRPFWSEDSHGRPERSKHEGSCRDAFLDILRRELPSGVTAEPERSYAAGTRADITVSYGGINIPIELKKATNDSLWSGLRDQLIDQYTEDPATDGYGIYMPLWFGLEGHKIPPPPPSVGRRPTTPEELQQQLEQDLTAEEARKISVLVLDVSKPGS